AMALDVPLEQARRCVLHELRTHGDPRLVRHGQLLRARSPEHGETLAVRTMGGERGKAALADPWLSGDQHDLPRPRTRLAARALHDRSLVLSPHERRPRPRSPP